MESNKATVAGVLDITAGIFGFVGGIPLLVIAIGGAVAIGMAPEPEATRLAFIPLALFLPLSLLCFISGLIAIFGGVAASIAAVFCFFPVGIAAIVFTVLAEPEFRAARETIE